MQEYKFSIPITIDKSYITSDIHVGYQNFFSLFKNVKIAYLKQFGYTELNIEGYISMVAEANCRYKDQLFHKDVIDARCSITKLTDKYFIMNYSIEKDGKICALGSTRHLCYDRDKEKMVHLPEPFVNAVKKFEGVRLILNS